MNQHGETIVDTATGNVPPAREPDKGKDPAAVSLGRKGGLIGGKVRAANTTNKQLSAAAKRVARARGKKNT